MNAFTRVRAWWSRVSWYAGSDRHLFLGQLNLLLASGMGLTQALETAAEEATSARARALIGEMRRNVDAGEPLWRALEQARVFSPPVIALLRVGESSGTLVRNLRVVVEQEDQERFFRGRVRSALLYPAFVLSVTGVVGTAIAWFILPRLSFLFAQMKIEIPLMTRVLIRVGIFLGKYGYVVIPLIGAALAAAFYLLFVFPRTKEYGERLLRVVPGVGRLIQEVETARFGYVLGTLLRVGVPLPQALDALEHTTQLGAYQRLYAHLRRRTEEGFTFQNGFQAFPDSRALIPRPVQQLVAASEQSGSLVETLESVHRAYREKTDATSKDLAVILEPVMLVIVWLGVVFVALAVILPIYGLVGGFTVAG